ncbi:MAG: histidine kinase [Candidatus Kapabacteria bacterium]|nr:histidine kinase [Candidatus Kapabacteria bacterium]
MIGLKFQILFLTLFFFNIYDNFSQNYNVELIKKEEGLSQRIIISGLEDSHGFMWFGSQNGLNRYDGKEFVVFQHNSGDTSSISNNIISDISEDINGFIWIATPMGRLDKLDPKTGKCKRFILSDENLEAKSFISTILFKNYDGNLWTIVNKIDGNTTLKYYNVLKDRFETYKSGIQYMDSIIMNSHLSVDTYIGQGGVLIFKTLNIREPIINPFGNDIYKIDKLIILNTNTNTIKVINHYKDYYNLKFIGKDEFDNPLIRVSSDKDPFKIIKLDLNNYSFIETNYRIDNRWLDKAFHLNIFYHDKKMFASVKVSNIELNKKINEYNGLFQFDDSNWLDFKKFTHIHAIFPTYSGFSKQEKIFSLTNNIIWDYHDNGLIKIVPKFKKVQTYKYNTSDVNSISNNIVRSVFIDKDNVLWVGTYKGLNKLDSETKKWVHYSNINPNPDYQKNIFNIIKDGKNNKLILGTNNGVFLFDKKNGSFTNYSKTRGLSKILEFQISNNIWGLLLDKNELWIGTLLGLFKNELGTNIYKSYSSSGTKANLISYEGISTIYKDRKNNIWIGTHNGLNRYLPEIDGFKVYKHNPKDTNSLCGNNIWSICEDKTGNLWVGAYNSGINKYNPLTDNFSTITSSNGLPDEGISSIVCDADNNLWLGSMKGLIKFDQRKNKFIRYTEKDGFQGDEYSYNAASVSSDNQLVFGGSGGVSIFSPKDLQNNPNIPKIVISKLFFKDSLVSYLMEDGDTIKTDYKTDYIKIQFSALDFVSPQLNQYAFKVEGLHKDWIYLGNQNSIILAGVEPGEYTLHIKASNNDGVWNEKGISIHLSIIPPFWGTLWFKIIAIIFIVLIIFANILYFWWRSREKNLAKKRIVSLQLKSLQAQMNPHFIFNSLNSILSLIINDDKSRAMQYLSKFSKLLRDVIEKSRAEVITLDQEIDQINLYFELEQLRFDNKFNYSIDIDENINPEEIFVPTLFLQPYIENSIKHGRIQQVENGKIDVKIRESVENLIIHIIDNGVGRKKTDENIEKDKKSHKSFGMKISKDRMEIINSKVSVIDLIDDNGKAAGTKVEIIIYNYKK